MDGYLDEIFLQVEIVLPEDYVEVAFYPEADAVYFLSGEASTLE